MPGRWPANVILMHLPGCRLEGSKKVTPSNGSGKAFRENQSQGTTVYGDKSGIGGVGLRGLPDGGFVGSDGMEEVDAWVCAPGCPAADIDEQSGCRKSAYPNNPAGATAKTREQKQCHGAHNTYAQGLDTKPCGTLYSDHGGAARFFKQVQAAPEGDRTMTPPLITIHLARKPLVASWRRMV